MFLATKKPTFSFVMWSGQEMPSIRLKLRISTAQISYEVQRLAATSRMHVKRWTGQESTAVSLVCSCRCSCPSRLA